MLDSTTKQRIDSARDILVGIVPDPTAQVEQITTALIYKFMDDMDKESQELGGEAKFFTNGFDKYSWPKLLDKRLSGQERLNLYVDAISNMSNNPHIPQLFRDIFKGAFLPHRNPETLSLFLKEINNFTYDHSETLGNAFEYLLSVLGAQGDAGQFRTPRHIIDFIVEVIDPKKNETILDPACGTAGFLISAYKHILKHNSSDFKSEKDPVAETALPKRAYQGNLIKLDEKAKLMNNFVGYDIWPGMVKLSLVNMYLHGFSKPKIYEYDTLTSEKYWNEQFDVIMANPPFMSPKGGIRPHSRFSVNAKRSEVLFVDYILEHLNLKGRAGIIVPEGIIFRAENAYKKLRKMLVESGLFAVVSLPQGVFNPYSGTKTSILLVDNQLAQTRDEILFLKIENDGLDLGAQRQPIDKNDLPQALETLQEWQQGKKKESSLALWAKKEKIAENGDYNLTGERYRKTENIKHQKWPMVELEKIAEVNAGNSAPQNKKLFENGKYPFCRTSDVGKVHISSNLTEIKDKLNQNGIQGLKLFKKGTILFPKSGASVYLNHRAVLGIDSYVSSHLATIFANEKKILSKFLFNFLCKKNSRDLTNNQDYPSVKLSEIKKIKIPLPPLEVQESIVRQIEVKQNAINHAKEIIKNLERERRYFGKELRKLADVEMIQLGDVLNYEQPTKYIVASINYKNEYKTPVLTAGKSFILGYTNERDGIFSSERLPVIIFDDFTTANKFVDFPFKVKSSAMKILSVNKKNKADIKFIFLAMQDLKFDASRHKRYWIAEYSKLEILLPPIEVQKQLVAEAEKEEEIIASNRHLIELMEAKIAKVLEQI